MSAALTHTAQADPWPESLELELDMGGRHRQLLLQRSQGLFGGNYQHIVITPDGVVRHKAVRFPHCHYRGAVADGDTSAIVGHAALSLCDHTLRGTLWVRWSPRCALH